MSQQMELPIFHFSQNYSFVHPPLCPAYSNAFIHHLPVLAKPSRLRKKKIYNPCLAKGKWTYEEQQAYISFLQSHSQFMETSLKRKLKKVFLAMSQAIGTRDADQCRSHHQKMILYRSSIAEIVKYYRKTVGDSYQAELKDSEKPTRMAEYGLSTKEDLGSSTRIVAHGNRVKIQLQTSKMLSYDF